MSKLNAIPEVIKKRMMECQVEQGNKADWSVFERDIRADKDSGGFTWEHTKERAGIWGEALGCYDFQPFFRFHDLDENENPKRKPRFEPIPEQVMWVWDDNPEKAEQRVVFGKWDDMFIAYSGVSSIDELDAKYPPNSDCVPGRTCWENASLTDPRTPKVREITLSEIAEKLGVDLEDIRIEGKIYVYENQKA